MASKRISSGETTPLMTSSEETKSATVGFKDDYHDDDDDDDDEDDDDYDESEVEEELSKLQPAQRFEARMADRLSVRLLSIPDDDEEAQDRLLRKSLALLKINAPISLSEEEEEEERQRQSVVRGSSSRISSRISLALEKEEESVAEKLEEEEDAARRRLWTMVCMAISGLITVVVLIWVGVEFVGPPNQPVGPYRLIERQEGEDFFQYYTFYEGRDSVGSNGFNMYIGRERATQQGIVNITMERDEMDVYNIHERRKLQLENTAVKEEPFIYMGSSATASGPRDSIRLEGNRRFNRGLFIIDLRHMPAGCGMWPAFWLTDEANWPVNGEIDIVEGVNYQSVAKTALHTTKGCSMNDIPLGVMTGNWDTAQGIPDSKTGVPDMTLRYARDCFVYNPHQWLNQGCVAVHESNTTLGQPVNDNGGGVYVLEWDPMNRHIRAWVFSPHVQVPDNLVAAIRTASQENRVDPDPSSWPVPYAYYAVGEGTDCPANHFRQMRLVFNLAFCGSVSGNRYFMDCPAQFEKYKTCNEWVQSDPDEMKEAYWKIRGVYVYEREWERTWIT